MRKLVAVIMVVALMVTMSATAFAANTTGGSTRVSFSVEPTYTVTIPTDVTIGTEATETTVSAENVVVNKGKYVSVTLSDDNDFTVATAEGAVLTYTVSKDGENVAAGGEILAVNPKDGKTGAAEITFAIDESAIQYAGTYTGTATFTVAVKDVPVTTITFSYWGVTFTADAGMTWNEWIESAYNDGNNEYDWIFETDGEHVYTAGDYGFFMLDDNGEVSPDALIVAEYSYWSYA